MSGAEPVNRARRRKSLSIAAVCYLLFVVYGSLVPLDFRPGSLDAAWRSFLGTKYLDLDAGSRADWVANILLYIPLAYLLCAAFAAGPRSWVVRLVVIVATSVICAAVAIGIEFTQLFFPPRTVSLNDIVAEFIGSGLGIGIWIVWRGALARLWTAMERGGLPAIRAAVVGYVLVYLALGLFPYDFLVSKREFAEKFAGAGYGLVVASGTCDQLSLCAGKVIAEIMAVVPLGVLLGMVLGKGATRIYATAALWGLALGLTLEVAQLFLASGVSEGLSVLTRVAGVTLGVALHRHVRLQRLAELQPYVTQAVLVAGPLYLVALMWANAWFGAPWVGIEQARAGFQEVHWMPFYFHYFTTETQALRSLLAVVAMYSPAGVGYWIWTLRRRRDHAHGSALVPALVAAPLALAMEMGKLFVPGKHPDPTDVLIAMAAAAGAFLLARQMHRWAVQGEPTPPGPAHAGAIQGIQAQPAAATGAGRVVLSFVLLACVGIALLYYPLGGAVPALALGLYGALLWRYPGICLPTILASLPLLNFAPWSGWILVNEFDLLVAVTLAVRLLQPHSVDGRVVLSGGAKVAIGVLAASFFGSAIIGLLPLSPFDANALVSYYGSFNSLAQLKGFAWALALLPLLLDEMRDAQRMEKRMVTGMLAGLSAVLAVVIWERATFAGLVDFAAPYRVEGTFPELHTGGGDVHAYLVMAIPFVVAWVLLRPTALAVVLGTPLFMLASYGLGVTFARGGYVGYGGAMVILAVGLAIHWLRRGARTIARMALAAVPPLAGLVVMVPIVFGTFMESRLAGTQAEGATRTRHWAKAVEMMDAGPTTAVFGMGLGTFPKTALFKDHDAASATFSYGREGGNQFVRLGSGRPLYLDQQVAVVAGQRYALSLDLRSSHPKAAVDVPLCEKSIQHSFRCKTLSVPVKSAGKNWEHHEVMFDSDEVGSGPVLLRRPVVLSLTNSQRGSIVDVDNVRLRDASGRDLVANGDFSRGGARWYFTADDHLPWHIFNLWVQVLFEQGWVGVLAFAGVLAMSLSRLAMGMWRGDIFSATLLASTVGFLMVGLTESLFDGPRVTTLFFLLLFAGMLRPVPRAGASSSRG